MSPLDDTIDIADHSWHKAIPDEMVTAADDTYRGYLTRLAAELGVTWPEGFESLMPVVQGRTPTASTFVVWNSPEAAADNDLSEGALRNVGTFALVCPPNGTDLDWYTTRHWLTEVEPGLVPFAFDLRHNLICLDYDAGEEPAISYVALSGRGPGTNDIRPVDASFVDFIESLFSDEGETDIEVETPRG